MKLCEDLGIDPENVNTSLVIVPQVALLIILSCLLATQSHAGLCLVLSGS